MISLFSKGLLAKRGVTIKTSLLESSKMSSAAARLTKSSEMDGVTFLLSPPTVLKGVGRRSNESLNKLGIRNIRDLLMHIPRKIVQSRVAFVSDITEENISGTVFTISVKVVKIGSFKNQRASFFAHCEDEKGSLISVIFFGELYFATDLLRKYHQSGHRVYISGKVSKSNYGPGGLQMSNPKVSTSLPTEDYLAENSCQAVYPLTEGITSSKLAAYNKLALSTLATIVEDDWLCPEFRKQKDWPSLSEALHALHSPRTEKCLLPSSKNRERLAFDEIVSYFIAKLSSVSTKDFSISSNSTLTKDFLTNLPFQVSSQN